MMVAHFAKPSIVSLLVLLLAVGVVHGQQQQQQNGKWKRRNSSPRVRGQTDSTIGAGTAYKKQKGSSSSSSVVMPNQEVALATTTEGGGRDLQLTPPDAFFPGIGLNYPILECDKGTGKGKGGKKGKKYSKKNNVSPYCDTGLPPETCIICGLGFCLCLDCFSFPEFCLCYEEFVDIAFNEADELDYLEALFFCWCETAGDDLFGSTIDPLCGPSRRELKEDWNVASEHGAGWGGETSSASTTRSGRGPVLPEGFDTTVWTRYDIATEETVHVIWCNDFMEDTPLCKDCTEDQFCCMEIPTGPVCVDEADEADEVGSTITIPSFPDIGGASWMN